MEYTVAQIKAHGVSSYAVHRCHICQNSLNFNLSSAHGPRVVCQQRSRSDALIDTHTQTSTLLLDKNRKDNGVRELVVVGLVGMGIGSVNRFLKGLLLI